MLQTMFLLCIIGVLFILSLGSKIDSNVLIINVLGVNHVDIKEALRHTEQFFHMVAFDQNFFENTACVLFAYPAGMSMLQEFSSTRVSSANCTIVTYASTPLPDKAEFQRIQKIEHISAILESLNRSISMSAVDQYSTNSTTSLSPARRIASLSFSSTTTFVPTKDFRRVFGLVGSGGGNVSSTSKGGRGAGGQHQHQQHDVVLLGKVRRLTSVSDWHDLSVLVLSVTPLTVRWLQLVHSVFRRHAADRCNLCCALVRQSVMTFMGCTTYCTTLLLFLVSTFVLSVRAISNFPLRANSLPSREAFTLLDPRPAILEASLQLRATLRVGYFRRGEVCVPRARRQGAEGGAGPEGGRCKQTHGVKTLMELHCGSKDPTEQIACTVVDEPHAWKAGIDRNGLGNETLETRLTPIGLSNLY